MTNHMNNDEELSAGAAAARAVLLGLTTVIAIGVMLLVVNQYPKITGSIAAYIDGEPQ